MFLAQFPIFARNIALAVKVVSYVRSDILTVVVVVVVVVNISSLLGCHVVSTGAFDFKVIKSRRAD
jgi:hypothetical protein